MRRMQVADLQFLSKHELVTIRKIEFVVTGGVRRAEFEQFTESAGDQFDGRRWKQFKK